MLNSKIKVKVGGSYDPIPADKYTVQIYDIESVTQFNSFKGEDTEMLKYQFVVLDEKDIPDSEEGTRGRYLWSRVNPVLSGKSNLMKLVKAVYGRDLTREEMQEFDPEAIVGRQIDVMVEQNPSKDNTTIYNNIISYSKNVKELEAWMEVAAGNKMVEKESETVVADLDGALPGSNEQYDELFGKDDKAKAKPKAKKK